MNAETVLSVVAGGSITIVVSLIFNYLSSKKLDGVAQRLHGQTDLLRTESEQLKSISKGIVMALEKPGEFEPVYNEDGSFKGWHVTQQIYTLAVPVDEEGNRLDLPRHKRWWRKMFGA